MYHATFFACTCVCVCCVCCVYVVCVCVFVCGLCIRLKVGRPDRGAFKVPGQEIMVTYIHTV